MADTELPLSYYKALVEHSVDVLMVIEAEGKTLYVSPSVEAAFGYTQQEQIGKNALSFIHPADLPHILSLIAEGKTHSERRYSVELRIKHKDGSWRWVQCSAQFLPDEAGMKGIIIHARDVTQRKEKIDTTSRLQKAVEAINEAIYITDINDTIIYVNRAFTALYEYTTEELVGKATSEFLKMVQMDEKAYPEAAEKLHAKQVVKVEVVQKTKSGQQITTEGTINPILDDHDNIVGFVGIHHNISERKKLETALAEGAKSLEMYKLAVEHATNHIVITDPDGKILFANKGVEKVTGFTIEEVLGQTPRLWGNQMGREFYEKFWHTIKDNRQAFIGEVQNKRKNGELYWTQAAVSPIVKNDQLIGFIGVEEDITNKKQLLSELEESKGRFEAFMQKNPNLVWMKDAASHHVYINEAYAKIFGVTVEEAKTKTDYDIFSKETADVLHADDLRVIASGLPEAFEERATTSDGTKRIWSVYRFPFKDALGNQMVGGMASDITERKKVEQALQERTVDLEKMNALMVGREVKMSDLKDKLSKAMAELEALKRAS